MLSELQKCCRLASRGNGTPDGVCHVTSRTGSFFTHHNGCVHVISSQLKTLGLFHTPQTKVRPKGPCPLDGNCCASLNLLQPQLTLMASLDLQGCSHKQQLRFAISGLCSRDLEHTSVAAVRAVIREIRHNKQGLKAALHDILSGDL